MISNHCVNVILNFTSFCVELSIYILQKVKIPEYNCDWGMWWIPIEKQKYYFYRISNVWLTIRIHTQHGKYEMFSCNRFLNIKFVEYIIEWNKLNRIEAFEQPLVVFQSVVQCVPWHIEIYCNLNQKKKKMNKTIVQSQPDFL